MRKYKSTKGQLAIATEHPHGVLVEVEGKMRLCPDMGEAVSWLAAEYSVAWLRIDRYAS